MDATTPASNETATGKAALCLVGEGPEEIWGRPTAERLKIQFKREGVTDIVTTETAADYAGPVVFIKADALIDQPLVAMLPRRINLVLTTGDRDTIKTGPKGTPLAVVTHASNTETALAVLAGDDLTEDMSLLVRAPEELDAAFWGKLRKNETPYAFTFDKTQRNKIEWRMFMGTYKGATDFITKHVWPRPAFYVTRAIAPTFISPNLVTTLSALMVVLAFWWFWQGNYVPGIIAAWLMTFLDTVDGKLARTTLTSSTWGDIFDHGIDLIHPPFWYYAFAIGLVHHGISWPSDLFWWILGAIIGGYVLQRVVEGIAIGLLGLEIHIWRPIDTFFRQITARRNPNLAILTIAVIITKPDWGLIAVAAWTVICFVLHGVQLAQAFAAKAQQGKLVSWMQKSETGT